jgi:hypothetical protein
MVGASDVDSSSAYSSSSSSSSEDEIDAVAPTARRVTRMTQTPILRMRYMTSYPSCVRRTSILASCLIIVMTCLEKQRR